MTQYLPYIQVTISVLLIVFILFQHKGSALGGAFGGGDANVFQSKRGMNKFLHYGSVILAILFFVSSVVGLLFQ
jgi:protein translocase SecG subunit